MDTYDLIVVGAGPGGYIAAIRAAQLGLNVACVDKQADLGGTCLRVGCIPSKALLESSDRYYAAQHELAAHGVKVEVELDLATMLKRKDRVVKTLTGGVRSLFKKNKIQPIQGLGRLNGQGTVLVDGAEGTTKIGADRIILAPGTRPATLPGVELDGERVLSSTEALSFGEVPAKLTVIGAGYIGLELGSVWSRLGSDVVVLEYLDRILPGMDLEIAKRAAQTFTKQGLDMRLGSKVTGVSVIGKGKASRCKVDSEGQDSIECDAVLVAVGRSPATDNLGLEEAGIQLDKRGFIVVDASYRTSAEGIYAVGDAIGGPQLAHKAEAEGVACVERMLGGYGHVNYDAIPGVVYTQPEIAAVGKTEEELEDAGVDYKKGVFPHRASARARTIGHIEGLTKMLAHATTDRILGVHIIGPHAGDLIAEAAAAIEFGATAEDLYRTSHAHPTLAETLKEAALATAGRTLNL